MYKEKELFEKVDEHINERDYFLLKSLVRDLDEFNDKCGNGKTELYIDFDNIGNDSEFDPYETFSIRLHSKVDNTKPDTNVHDYLSIHQLDDCLCAIECYFEEVVAMLKQSD